MQVSKFTRLFLPTTLVLACAASAIAQAAEERDDGTVLQLVSNHTGVAVENLSLLGSTDAFYAFSGRTARSFKVIDDQGQTHALTLDERGREVDPEVLLYQDEQARLAQYGKLEPALFDLLELAPADGKVAVAIWLVEEASAGVHRPMPEEMEYLFPSEDDMTAFLEATASARADEVHGIVQSVAQRLDDEAIGYELNDVAPVIYAELYPDQVRDIGTWAEVDRIYSTPAVESTLDVARQTVYAHTVESLGITGSGVRVAQIEVGGRVATANPNLAGIIQDATYVCSSASGHSTYVAGILRSRHASVRGIAPNITLRAAGSCSGNEGQLTNRSTAASTWGARAFNCSFGRDDGRSVGSMDRFYDSLSLNNARTIVIAAGNEGDPGESGNVLSPATAYNVLTVGSFDDKNTVSWTGDTMSGFTSWRDPLSAHSDREKPEISAPGTGIKSTLVAWPWVGTYGSGNGTSYAAPIVTGAAALMMQRNTTLQSWPESVKAILMASATHDVEAPTRLSEKEGAGSLVAYYADLVTRRVSGNWGGRSYTCSAAADTDVMSMYLTAGRRARVVISWDNDPSYASYATQPCADLDLRVMNSANAIVASSSSWDNNYEIVDFTVPVSGTYRIRVHKFRCSQSPRFIGYAWFQR